MFRGKVRKDTKHLSPIYLNSIFKADINEIYSYVIKCNQHKIQKLKYLFICVLDTIFFNLKGHTLVHYME